MSASSRKRPASLKARMRSSLLRASVVGMPDLRCELELAHSQVWHKIRAFVRFRGSKYTCLDRFPRSHVGKPWPLQPIQSLVRFMRVSRSMNVYICVFTCFFVQIESDFTVFCTVIDLYFAFRFVYDSVESRCFASTCTSI